MKKGRFSKFDSLIGRWSGGRLIRRNARARILVCLHMFYAESWPVIARYLSNLSCYSFDLVITTPEGQLGEACLEQIRTAYPQARIEILPNSGFDIGPFVDALNRVDLSSYDIVFKIQSKGTHRPLLFMYDQLFKYDDWFYNLFEGVLGGRTVHKVVDALMNGGAKLVAAENLIVPDPIHKRSFVEKFCKERNLPFVPDYRFVAGTCFAMKASALQPLKDLGLTIDDFAATKRGDFSLAHSLERWMCFAAAGAMKGMPVRHNRYERELVLRRRYSPLRMLEKKEFKIDYDYFYRMLEPKAVKSIRIVRIPVGSIVRRWKGELVPLAKCSPFLYLNGDKEAYQNYCEANLKMSGFEMTEERYTRLIDSMKDFDPTWMPVVLGERNEIHDGQHRCCILLKRFGPKHMIKVIRLEMADPVAISTARTGRLMRYIRGWQDFFVVRKSPLFDARWYRKAYPDISKRWFSLCLHYCLHGWREGRNPSPWFGTARYLQDNPDVRMADINPLAHYERKGFADGRRVVPVTPGKTNVPAYDSRYERELDLQGRTTDIKALAFHLPQFHRFKENDEWWGEGFTEWTNTRKARPRFKDHYQPREPHEDIGYYDLADWRVLKRQAEMAKRHGIYGFCFYHYWFSGKRLMEKPVDQLLEHPEIDLPFCLCWANENWTRAWDGGDKEVLIAQGYEDDSVQYIKDLAKYIADPRYIRVNGKPVVMIYRPNLLPDARRTFARWREWARENGIGEILIWIQLGCVKESRTEYVEGADAVVEFPPHGTASRIQLDPKRFGAPRGEGRYFDYSRFAEAVVAGKGFAERSTVPVYRGITLGWDNSARRAVNFACWFGFSLRTYHAWLSYLVKWTRNHHKEDERFLFINAWNEWAEGTYLEPDRKYGYASINTTSKALVGWPFEAKK